MKPLYQELPFAVDNYINFYREDLPHFIVPWHYHPEIEIMCIEKGWGTRFVGDHIGGYEEGDVCMRGPQLPHEWRNDKEFFDSDSGLRATCHCVYFRKELFEGILIRLPEMANIRELIERSRFNKVYRFLVKNFNKPIKLEEVAAVAGLTPTAFCRYFKERTKKTFVQYLNDMRIGHAKKFLIEGKMKISTLSMEVGFNNLSNFIEQFKKSTNMLPSEYQEKYGVKKKKII